jgi:hypothetical protein
MRAQSNDASPISQRVPKVDPRTVRSHMVRLGLAVKLAQGAYSMGSAAAACHLILCVNSSTSQARSMPNTLLEWSRQ